MSIIAISGFIGSGKDTVAQYLVENCGYRRESFAGTLKDAVAAVFGWDRTLLEGATPEARAWREGVDPWWAARLNIPHLTPRWVLQQWGTEVCRRHFHDDVWIASLENKLRACGNRVVVSDCRFLNELDSLKKMGAKTVRVRRGPEPMWFKLGVEASNPYSPHRIMAERQLRALDIHESEWAWLSARFDVMIENEGSLEDLYSAARSLV